MNLQSDQLFRLVVGIAAFLCLCALGLAVRFIVKAARTARDDIHKIHLQQATIIKMMLRAGFRPAKSDPDWRDDGDQTQLPSFTRFDWQSPEQRHGR
jgi:hypothetical protein